MIARLVEASYFAGRDSATDERITFWLRELRSPQLLLETVARFPQEAERTIPSRGLLQLAVAKNADALRRALLEEEGRERDADRLYWKPLRDELERLRREARERT